MCDQRVSERERHRPINYDDFTMVVRNSINNINYKPMLMDWFDLIIEFPTA